MSDSEAASSSPRAVSGKFDYVRLSFELITKGLIVDGESLDVGDGKLNLIPQFCSFLFGESRWDRQPLVRSLELPGQRETWLGFYRQPLEQFPGNDARMSSSPDQADARGPSQLPLHDRLTLGVSRGPSGLQIRWGGERGVSLWLLVSSYELGNLLTACFQPSDQQWRQERPGAEILTDGSQLALPRLDILVSESDIAAGQGVAVGQVRCVSVHTGASATKGFVRAIDAGDIPAGIHCGTV